MTRGSGQPALTTAMASGPGAPPQQRWGAEVRVVRRFRCDDARSVSLPDTAEGSRGTRKRATVGW